MKKLIFFILGLLLIGSGPVFAQESTLVKVKAILTENGSTSDFSLSGWQANKQVWEKLWLEIASTELSPVSPHTIHSGAILIAVKGKLYSIDLSTGEINFGKAEVGYCSHKPVVGKDGTIYCSGYYGPVITAVTPDGKVKWSYENEDMWWPDEILLKGKTIQVMHYDPNGEQKMVSTFSKSGKCLRTKKRK